jgi:hypothetical protein
LHGSPVNVPTSKLPFWNCAADANAEHTNAKMAGRMRFILVLPWIWRSTIRASVLRPRFDRGPFFLVGQANATVPAAMRFLKEGRR